MYHDKSDALSRAVVLIHEAWSILAQSPFLMRDLGLQGARLPDLSEAGALARSQAAAELLTKLDALDRASLPSDVATTIDLVRFTAERWSREAEWYWLVFDPMGVGFFAMFAPTAYGGGFLLNNLVPIFATFRFDSDGDVDRYLALVSDYALLVEQLHARTVGQAERGIHMPMAQLDQAVPLLAGIKDHAARMLIPASERLKAVGEAARQRIAERIQGSIIPAFEAFSAAIAASSYRAAAPQDVGLSQYPGGAAVYAELARQHTTLDLSPEQIHQAGLDRMARVHAAMQALFDRIGFTGTSADYLARIEQDPKWRAEGNEGIAAVFNRYIDRVDPLIDRHFNFKPSAGYTVEPLPESLSDAMTFGYYDPPSRGKVDGRYLFNTRNLSRNALANLAALNYHELVPGHHFHVASQRENDLLHPFRKHGFVNAFNEGWAEYAATLAGEMGMYEAPEEQFGRYMMDAFLTCRLVVDTGMNALGWSLEEARAYLRTNGFMPETEVKSETLRYSCDVPGQALAYKLGDEFLIDLRERMRAELGERFDVRDFHDAVLRPGSLPLSLVAANVVAATERLAEQHQASL